MSGPSNPFLFEQSRFPGGYQILHAGDVFREHALVEPSHKPAAIDSEDDRMITIGMSELFYELETYELSSDAFLKFAALRPLTDESGVLEFAQRFGLLGLRKGDGQIVMTVKSSNPAKLEKTDPTKVPYAFPLTGEFLSAWQRESTELRKGVAVWSALRKALAGELEDLSSIIRWVKPDHVVYDSHPHLPDPPEAEQMGFEPRYRRKPGPDLEPGEKRSLVTISSPIYNVEWRKIFSGDIVAPAKRYLQQLLNERLDGRISTRLLWNGSEDRPETLTCYFVPDTLLSALWLQFADVITGNKTCRQCPICNEWIVVSRDTVGNRPSRRTCSNGCRQKSYNLRIAEAQRLKSEGLPPANIAQRLNTDVKRIRVWLKKKRSDAFKN